LSRNTAAAALVVALSTTAAAQVAILHIQVTEGEGGVHAPGSREARPLTVAVTDEMGRPVRAAAVSFHLPEEGPSGLFANGLRTEVVTADDRGRASAPGLRWNRVGGRLQIRVIASKEQARAGIVSFQYITGTENGRERGAPAPTVSRRRAWWIAVAALAGGGAAAGGVWATRGGTGRTPAAAALVTPTVSIGAPTVTVGKP
jgi:hypothetical protein